MPHTAFAVHRMPDHELVGFLRPHATGWDALTIFGARVATATDEGSARAYLIDHGLALLTRLWYYYDPVTAVWHAARIQEAHPHAVRIALGFYPLPGVPTRLVRDTDFATGHILQLEEP